MKYFKILIFLIFLSGTCFGQNKFGIGASMMYNFQTEGIGTGLRVQIPLGNKLSVMPQAYYFFPFNQIHEYYIGLNLHYNLLEIKNHTGYLNAGAFYNQWINFDGKIYTRNNFLPEVGGGILFTKRCLRPFIEQRYNPLWREGTFRIGVMWYPGCNNKKSGNRSSKKRGAVSCPAYN